MVTMTNWDLEYLGLAFYIAGRLSKDPSTKVGAVITRPDHSVVSLGVNGFPKNCIDSLELFNNRDLKYPRIIHAEQNAMAFARQDIQNCTIHVAVPSPIVCTCPQCTAMIIQRGIRRVVFPHINKSDFGDRWGADCRRHSLKMYREVGVEIIPIAEDEWRQLPGLEDLTF